MPSPAIAYAVIEYDSNGLPTLRSGHNVKADAVSRNGIGDLTVAWADGVFTQVPAVVAQGVFNPRSPGVVDDFTTDEPPQDLYNSGCYHANLKEITASHCTVRTGGLNRGGPGMPGSVPGEYTIPVCVIAIATDPPQDRDDAVGLNLSWSLLKGSMDDRSHSALYSRIKPWGEIGFQASVGYCGDLTDSGYFLPESYSTFKFEFDNGSFTGPPAVVCAQVFSGDDGVWTDYRGGELRSYHQNGTLYDPDHYTLDGSKSPIDDTWVWLERYDANQIELSTWGNHSDHMSYIFAAIRHVAVLAVGAHSAPTSAMPPYACLLGYYDSSNSLQTLAAQNIKLAEYKGDGVVAITFATPFQDPPVVLVNQVYGGTDSSGTFCAINQANSAAKGVGSDNAFVLYADAQSCAIKTGNTADGGTRRNFSLIAIGTAASYAPRHAQPMTPGPSLAPNDWLAAGELLKDPTGAYKAIYGKDNGALVIHNAKEQQVWSSGTESATPAGRARLLSNGDFCLYRMDGAAEVQVWETGTACALGATADPDDRCPTLNVTMDSDGVLKVMDEQQHVYWTHSPRQTLAQGERLMGSSVLVSADGKYCLSVASNLRLRVTRVADGMQGFSTPADSATRGLTLPYAMVTADGDFGFYRADPPLPKTAIWSAGAAGRLAAYDTAALTINSDGSLVLTSSSGTVLWSSTTGGSTTWTNPNQQLLAPDYLSPGGSLTSSNGRYRLTFQTDGNLVLYNAQGAALWSTNTAGGTPAFRACMQSDGNFCLYKGQDQTTNPAVCTYASGTWNRGAVALVLGDDGSLNLNNGTGGIVKALYTPPAS